MRVKKLFTSLYVKPVINRSWKSLSIKFCAFFHEERQIMMVDFYLFVHFEAWSPYWNAIYTYFHTNPRRSTIVHLFHKWCCSLRSSSNTLRCMTKNKESQSWRCPSKLPPHSLPPAHIQSLIATFKPRIQSVCHRLYTNNSTQVQYETEMIKATAGRYGTAGGNTNNITKHFSL